VTAALNKIKQAQTIHLMTKEPERVATRQAL